MKVVAVLRTVQGPRHNALMPHWNLKKAAAAAGQFQNSESLLLHLLGLHRLQELNHVFDPSKVLKWAC